MPGISETDTAGAYLEVDTNQGTWWQWWAQALGGLGACPPENVEFYGCSEVLSGAFWSWSPDWNY